jgi:hypothetical protein
LPPNQKAETDPTPDAVRQIKFQLLHMSRRREAIGSLDKKQFRELTACPGRQRRCAAVARAALGRQDALGDRARPCRHPRRLFGAVCQGARVARGSRQGARRGPPREERLGFFTKPKLLIVDELGYLPFESNAAHLFFPLVLRRYERGSMLITSNRSVGEWGTVFVDPVVATATSTGCSITAKSSRSAATAKHGGAKGSKL